MEAFQVSGRALVGWRYIRGDAQEDSVWEDNGMKRLVWNLLDLGSLWYHLVETAWIKTKRPE